MKRVLLSALALILLLSGCGTQNVISDGKDTPNDVTPPTSSIESSETEDVSSNTDSSSVETPTTSSKPQATDTDTTPLNIYNGVDRKTLGSKEDVRMDYKPLPDIESITDAQIAKCMLSDGAVVTTTTDPAYKAKGAKAAIKMTVNKNKAAGQVIFAEKLKQKLPNGLDEAIVLDPVDGSLAGYDGIRYYVKVKRPEGKKYSELKLRFFFGSYSYYRSMYEYTSTLPEGDFEGYIEVPFAEMNNGYKPEMLGASVGNIAYFAFNYNLEGNAEGLEIYVSDFQAYREMYWE